MFWLKSAASKSSKLLWYTFNATRGGSSQ